MELLYLWIEDYKNIHKQGFNFSPNHDFHYNHETGVLEDKFAESGKQEQPENFFGEKISNVTAIIGKNGCGKTNLLDWMCLTIQGYKCGVKYIHKNKHLFIYKNKDENLYGFYSPFNIPIINKVENLNLSILKHDINDNDCNYNPIIDNFSEKYKIISYSNIFSSKLRYGNALNGANLFNIGTVGYLNKIRQSYADSFISIYDEQEELRILEFCHENAFNFHFFEIPKSIILNCNTSCRKARIKYKNRKQLEKELTLDNIQGIPQKLTEFYDNHINNLDSKTKIKAEFLYVFLLAYFFQQSEYKYGDSAFVQNGILKIEEIEFGEKPLIDELIKVLNSIIKEYEGLFSNVEYISTNKTKLKEKIDNQNLSIKEKEILTSLGIENIEKLSNFELHNSYRTQQNFLLRVKSTIEHLFTSIEFSFKKYNIFKLDITIKEEYEIYKTIIDNFLSIKLNKFNKPILNKQFDVILSSGETGILTLFSRLSKVKIFGTEKIILLLDEPDIYFHPEWCRKYLDYLIKYLKTADIFKGLKLQIILTSHSPFVASDLPKENIIFLDKDDDGNCVVKEGIDTFGANIHTLFRDGFFMESTFGEFAKNKIKQVVDWIENDKYEENKEKIDYIISSIGEPIIKNKLQSMIDEYLNKDKVNLYYDKLLKDLSPAQLNNLKNRLGDSND